MERYLCVHGHFYQPPRENPWLEAVEIQDSAHPYHDWNERITAECYAPNSASRILDGEGKITEIISNYARMSFDFGPTLLSWMEVNAPAVYRAIIDADKKSAEQRSGHGNAIAHAYNHMIMPLANSRDKRTQILWGIRDFEHRFGRFPEGMWLPETAVDVEALGILDECGIKFTVLAPHQAVGVRKIGSAKWKDVGGGKIDPSRSYLCKLPAGRKIGIFFYDGPISHSLAFGKVLEKGEVFVTRLFEGYSDARTWPQLLSISTDGETFGHHHTFGDMSLAFALNEIQAKGLASLTNYGEYLEKNPPQQEVRIAENSSWSCIHGIERWRSDCGCNSGGHAGWSQGWRKPLRDALDWLRDQLSFGFENKAKNYLKKPWSARDDYIEIVLDRSRDSVEAFLTKHAARKLTEDERTTVLKMLEIQRHAMLMYTSCGWFFDELSGLETVQVLRYAGRAVQLSSELFVPGLEDAFIAKLAAAKSNLKEHGDGGRIYDKFVRSSMLDLKKVGVHYAVSALFEDYPDTTAIYAYSVKREDRRDMSGARGTLSVGRISVTSEITGESELLSYSVLRLGGHDLNCGIRTFLGDEQYRAMKEEMQEAFERGAFTDIQRLMDKHFGMHTYSIKDLFRDEQRRVLNSIILTTLEGLEETYRRIYEDNRHLMGYLGESGVPVPRALLMAAEFALNQDLKKAFQAEPDIRRVHCTAAEAKRWSVVADEEIELAARRHVEEHMEKLKGDPFDPGLLGKAADLIELLHSLPVAINFWHIQNIYYGIAKTASPALLGRVKEGEEGMAKEVEEFMKIGRSLHFNIGAVLTGDREEARENG